MKGDTINHSEIMAEYARELGVTTDTAKRLYDAYANIIIAKAAQGRRVVMKDIGTIKVVPTPARMGRDISKGEPLAIPAGKHIKMTAHKTFKAAVL